MLPIVASDKNARLSACDDTMTPLSAPNVGDYCGRLVAYEVNGALREALSAAVDAETLARLPASVRAALA